MSAQEANKGGKKQKWVPLEANPDVLNRFASKLGMDTSKVSFCDVWGLDEVRTPCMTSSLSINFYMLTIKMNFWIEAWDWNPIEFERWIQIWTWI